MKLHGQPTSPLHILSSRQPVDITFVCVFRNYFDAVVTKTVMSAQSTVVASVPQNWSNKRSPEQLMVNHRGVSNTLAVTLNCY